MDDFFFARSLMAMSLAFHIVFAALGMGMPLLMVLADGACLRTGRPVYLELGRRWAKGTAILFAVGAVSGTVLSFELGLLWPGFMASAGAIIGMPFSLEGFAFFTEAIFLGVYLYGRNRLSPRLHWLAGVVVAVSGILSGVFVVTANAWMNAPAGFTVVDGRFTAIDPIAAMLNPASFHEVLHMTLAAYVATGFAVAAVHAHLLRQNPDSRFHRSALGLALAVAGVCIPLLVASGDLSARTVGRLQPAKLAAMEALYQTQAGAPLLLGGLPDDATRRTSYALPIPGGLSLLLANDLHARVTGLEEFPRRDWPDVRIVHWSFDLMVLCGFALLALAGWWGWLRWRGRPLEKHPRFLHAVVLAGPLGFVAIEAGWMVTEVGRQPWIIYHVMRTADSVTPLAGLSIPFAAFTILYVFLAVVVYTLLRGLFRETDGIMHPAPST
ncbi:MAG: cytochrome ubiquinol oxidase subunit I [Opitutales bacterium]